MSVSDKYERMTILAEQIQVLKNDMNDTHGDYRQAYMTVIKHKCFLLMKASDELKTKILTSVDEKDVCIYPSMTDIPNNKLF